MNFLLNNHRIYGVVKPDDRNASRIRDLQFLYQTNHFCGNCGKLKSSKCELDDLEEGGASPTLSISDSDLEGLVAQWCVIVICLFFI